MMQYPAQHYHRLSSYERSKMDAHALDWENEPSVYKEYPNGVVFPIPLEVKMSPVSFFELLQGRGREGNPPPLSFELLGQILLLTEMLTGRARHANGEIWFRSVASAGALYPCELYVACPGIAGLPAGLYHYRVKKPALVQIRAGNPRVDPAEGAAGESRLDFLISVVFFRSSWKYRDRAYRYHLLDSGHLLENLLLALRSFSFDPRVETNFDDSRVNDFLAVDPRREACLVLAGVPCEPAAGAGADLPLSSVEGLSRCSRTASRETSCEAVLQIHQASSVVFPGRKKLDDLWSRYGLAAGQPPEKITAQPAVPEVCRYPDVLLHRRSRRNFVNDEPLSASSFNVVVSLAAEGLESRFPAAAGLSCAIVAGNVAEREPGFYALNAAGPSLSLVAPGNFLELISHACLDQRWLAKAAVYILFFTDLAALEDAAGARGYRDLMLAAGGLGQRLYLGAAALGLGCCAIGAFYDREVLELVDLPEQASLVYLLAVGQVKK
jgi:SagB-type dehydrogenase family enzyme